MDVKGYKRKGVLVFDSHIPIIWLLVVGGGYCLFPGVIDMPEKCNFTNLLCNESRLRKEDKIIILNIGNELRNRVAGGTFKYLNLQHDPITDMNKLYWNEEIAKKATMIVSSCPTTSESFIDSHTIIESGDNAIEQIIIENSIDPTTYQPDHEIPNCEVSSITYEEKLTQCAPQKIKERVIRFLSEYGLSAEGRKYDIRDFWIVNRYGEPKLTFRRHESSQLGCSFMIRVSKTHYHAYLTCIHCSFNASLPTIGHPGENCPTKFPNLDAKYENLCSDSKNEYDNIEDDQSIIECKNETSLGTDSEGLFTETTESADGIHGISESDEMKKHDNITSPISDYSKGGKSGEQATLLPGQNQSLFTSTCKTTIVERNKILIEVSPKISSQELSTSSQTLEPPKTFSTSDTLGEVGDSTGTTSKMKTFDKTESISTTLIEEMDMKSSSKEMEFTTEISHTYVSSGKDVSITSEATTTVYGSTASISTFGIANLKTVASTIEPKEIIEKQLEDTSSMKSPLDTSTQHISTFESLLTGSSKFVIVTPATDSFSNISSASVMPTLAPAGSTESSTLTSISWTTSKHLSISGSTLSPTGETLMPLSISSPSLEIGSKDYVTTCKTTYIPSNKTHDAINYTHVSSDLSISALTQPSTNTVILSSTSAPPLLLSTITGSPQTITEKPQSIIISTTEKLMLTEIEISTQQMQTTKKYDSTTKKFMTRKKPTVISTEIFSTSAAIPTAVEATTESTSKIILLEQSTTLITEPTNLPNISATEITEVGGELLTSPAISVITSDTFKDHSTIISTQTTTCRTTILSINKSSTCKTTISKSKSISISSIPPSSFSAQLPNQIISTSTTYKTTIPTAKSSFISTKESTPISSLSITTDIIPSSIGQAIQIQSIKTTEPTAMTTLPSTKFSSYSPGLKITSSILPETTSDLSKITHATTDLISSVSHFASTAISIKEIDIAQAPLSSHLDSTPSSDIYTSSTYIIPKITSTQTTTSKIEMPPKESTYPIFITKTTLDNKAQISTEIVLPEISPTTISPIIKTEISTILKQTTSENIKQTSTIQITTTCRTTDSSFELISTTCKTTIHARASSIVPISIIPPITTSESKSEDIFSTTILPQFTISKSTFYEGVSPSSSLLIPTTTTCKTTSAYTNTIPSTTTCRTTIPTTESKATKTTCGITILESDSTITCKTTTTSSLTTTCKTTIPTSSLTTTCKTTIPTSKSIIEKTSIFTEDFINQMTTKMTAPTITKDEITLSTDNIPTLSSHDADIIIFTTTDRPIIDIALNITEQGSQWTSFPITTTCRTTTIQTAVPVSSSTCKTTIHQRQSISTTTGSSSITSLLSKATSIIPMSTATVTQSSEFQKPISIFPISTSTVIPQTQLSVSSLSIIPTSTTCRTTTLYESTLPTFLSTTTCRTTLTTIKLDLPTTTTCKTTSVIDTDSVTTSYKIISTIETPVSTEFGYQPIAKSTATYSTTSSTSMIVSTNLILPSTTAIPSTVSCRITGTSDLCPPSTNTHPITTTCKTTLESAYPSTSTCKTTYMDHSRISTIKIQETTLPTKKVDMINTAVPLSSTICKTDCITGSTITSTNTESEILPEGIINISTSSEPTSLMKSNESYGISESTSSLVELQNTVPTTTTCKTTTAILSTTCKTTILSTDTTTSTCKTTSITKITHTPQTFATNLPSTTTCQTPCISTVKSSSSEDIHKITSISIQTGLPAESTSTIESASPTNFTPFISSEKSYTESISTQKPEKLSEILPVITSTSSSISGITTCKTTYAPLGSVETSSCKTTIHSRKLPISSSAPITKLITQQPSVPSHISSLSSLAFPLTKVDLESTPITQSTSYSTSADINIPITSIQTIKSGISTSIMISETATASQSSTEIIIVTTTPPPPTIPSSSDYETNVSLIPQEDSTILEQLTTKLLSTLEDHTISHLNVQSTTCRTTVLESETTSTCKTTITAHTYMKESETKTSLSSTLYALSSETSPSTPSSKLMTQELVTTTCRTTEFSTLGSTTTCRTTMPTISFSLPSTTTCRTTIPTVTLSLPSTTTCRTTIPTVTLGLPSTTTCRTTIPTVTLSLPSTTTCKTTIPTVILSLPSTTTCRTTMPTISFSLPYTTTCKTTTPTSIHSYVSTSKIFIPTFLPTIVPTELQFTTTTCKTTIPILSTTSTCKTTIPTEFPTESVFEPTIITLLPLSNQSISSFAAPISAATSQVSPLLSSTMHVTSSTSSPFSLKEFKNYTCKTTMISRPEYSQTTSLEIITPSLEISTQFPSASINFTTISESSISKIEQIPTSTSISLTEGLSSKLSTFISSLLPADWRSPQSQPTSAYPASIEQTDITSIFLSSLAPSKDITSTLSSPSFNLTTAPSNTFITDMAGQMFTSNLTTTTASTFVTDIHGYIISSSIPPTELSNTIVQAFTVPSRTTFRSHRGSTLAQTNLFPETTTSSVFSTIYSTTPCRSTVINGTGATCITTTIFDHSYTTNSSSAESMKDIFDNRNGTVSLSKSKPCLCINWYLICLIFTIAFIFAWCLLCWQKMLL